MIDKFDKWFVADWRQCWRWLSVHAHLIGTAVLGIVLLAPSLPDEVQAVVPVKWRALVLAVWAVLGLLARLKKQGPTP